MHRYLTFGSFDLGDDVGALDGHDLGEIFIIVTTHFRFSEFRDQPAVGLLGPPEPGRDYVGVCVQRSASVPSSVGGYSVTSCESSATKK